MNVSENKTKTHAAFLAMFSDYLLKYRKILILSPGLQYICSKCFFFLGGGGGAISRGAYFWRDVLLEKVLRLKMG